MNRCVLQLVGAGMMTAVCAPNASAAVVQQQSRDITSWVWISGCSSETQTANAPGLKPFHEQREVQHECMGASGSSTSSQQSTIEENALNADGNVVLSAGSPLSHVIHGMARSRFDVTFTVDADWHCVVKGNVAAARMNSSPQPGYAANAFIRLSRVDQPLDFVNVSLSPAQNQSLSQPVAFEQSLPAGMYRIQAIANTYADQSFNNAQVTASASFSFTLDITPEPQIPGDITGDGVVNVSDLLAVISNWGACPTPPQNCNADVAPSPNGDGVVNVADLLMVISNWG